MNTDVTDQSSCVMFLDFDGVTHPEPCDDAQLFDSLSLIEEELIRFDGVHIVVSSSWREHYSLDQLRAHFCADLRPRVIGVTPSIKRPSSTWLPGHVSRHEREWEIESWMKENRSWGTPWLAIDDRAHWFTPESPNLLLTQSETGFTREDQATLRGMLQERCQ